MNPSILSPHLPATCSRRSLLGLSMVIALCLATTKSVHANVYATNLRLNGGHTNLIYAASTNVAISYLLNEPASGGVTIVIKSSGTPVRTITLPGGGLGTTRGSNYVVWNGRDDASNNLATGSY